jgi:hypothetical protein
MPRLLIDDVTLVKAYETAIDIRFRGGATQTLTVPRLLAAWKRTLPVSKRRAKPRTPNFPEDSWVRS